MDHPILNQEIHEQPGVIEHLLSTEMANVSKITRSIRRKFNYIVIAARGTSDNAARYAQYLFGVHNQLQVALAHLHSFHYTIRPQI